MKKLSYIFIFLLYSSLSFGQQIAKTDTIKEYLGLVKWLTIEEAQEKYKQQPKPIMIDMYTDWCGWCKHMMKNTFSNPGLASYINSNFYPVRFNAETRDTIIWRGEKFVNQGTGKRSTHDLTFKLMGTKLSYPTTIFINNNYQFALNVPGYLEVKKIEPFLIYTLENIFTTTSIQDFQKYFGIAFPDSVKKDTTSVKWMKFQQALYKAKAENKKILVNTYTDWCNGCRVMNEAVYKDSAIAAYINKNYVAVNFNAQGNDTVVLNGNLYTRPAQQAFHPLALSLSQNKLTLPTLFVLDSDGKLIGPAPMFMVPDVLMPVLKYFNEDKYKTGNWNDYYKEYKKNRELEIK
ncbi:MAG: DUF255 domain-containing protein [Bacteroidota bacterium]